MKTFQHIEGKNINIRLTFTPNISWKFGITPKLKIMETPIIHPTKDEIAEVVKLTEVFLGEGRIDQRTLHKTFHELNKYKSTMKFFYDLVENKSQLHGISDLFDVFYHDAQIMLDVIQKYQVDRAKELYREALAKPLLELKGEHLEAILLNIFQKKETEN